MRHPHRPLALAVLLFGASAFAQQPPPPPSDAPPPPVARAAPADAGSRAPVATGPVQQWLVNPNGEVDGFLLADGTQVALAPHLSAGLLQLVKLGDSVQVSGWRTPNLPVVRAASVTATTTGRSVVDQPPPPGARPAGPPERGALTAMSSSGRVARLLYTDRGDVNGVLLEGGSIVRFPPHRGAALAPTLQVGSSVHARGWGSRSAQGSAFEATAIGPTVDGMRDLFAGPDARPGPRGGPRASRGPQAPVAEQPPPPPAS